MHKIVLISLALLYPFLSCKMVKVHYVNCNPIIFQVGDSLEIYLLNEIAARSGKDNVQAIIIDPQGGDFGGLYEVQSNVDNELSFSSMMRLSILYTSEGFRDSATYKSNRYVFLEGQLYPVYLLHVDDVLGCKPDLVNIVFDSGCIPEDTLLTKRNFLIADMARGEFYVNQDFEHPYGRVRHLNILWKEGKRLQFADFRTDGAHYRIDSIRSQPGCYTRSFSDVKVHPMPNRNLGDSENISYFIKTFFIADSSWTIDGDSALLNHQQGHFDIGEICSREMRKYAHEINRKYSTAGFANAVDSIRGSAHFLDSLYDVQTHHGSDAGNQVIWNARIRGMLDSLQQYSSPNGIIFKYTIH